jgi:octopine/nopaline transport system permease protein
MDFSFLRECVERIVPGIPTTLALVSISVAIGLVLALLLALMRFSPLAPLDWFARAYVFVFRGTPLAVQMFLIYFGLPQFQFLRQSFLWPFLREPYWCAIAALALNTAAYGSEILRGAFLSVPAGQIEAARAAGMSPLTLFRRIRMPIALRQALPGYTNEVIIMVKATSLASMVTLAEITGLAARIISQTYRVMEPFMVAALIYLVMNFLLTRATLALEWRLNPHLRPAPTR